MITKPSFADIGGVNVYPGSAVSVLWMGVWYDGTVVKLGPKKDLYKVYCCDSQSRSKLN